MIVGASGGHHHFKLLAGYIALVHKDERTSYGMSFPDVPGCIVAGDTFEEAVANAADALGAQ